LVELLETEGLSSKTAEIPETWQDLLERLVGEDPAACPKCKQGVLVRHPIDPVTGEVLPPKLPVPDT